MKTPSKFVLSLLAGLSLFLPSLAGAVNTAPIDTPLPTVAAGDFCTSLATLSGRLSDSVTSHYQQLTANFASRSQQLGANQAQAAKQLADLRAKADVKQQQNFSLLEARVQAGSQLQAAQSFESSVRGAVAAERAAVDSADSAYQQGVAAALAKRQTQLQQAADTYQAAIARALAKATTSCGAGVNGAAVSASLKLNIIAVRQTLQQALAAAQKIMPNLDVLKANRRSSVASAEAAFQSNSKQALAVLKAALAASPSPSPPTH